MVTNLKETIISSLFFHLILCLVMIAASHYSTGLFGGIQKIVSLDLVMEESKDRPAGRSDSEDEQPREFRQPFSDDETVLLVPADSNHPEEVKNNQEPEKKAESAAEPLNSNKAEQPAIRREGFTSLEAYHQFIILHKKIFAQKAGARVNQLLGEALRVNKREFYGGTAIVSLTFGPDGTLNDVLVDSASPALKAFLEEIGWGIVPSPAAYSLGYSIVQIEFSVMEGFMSFNINPR